jgi:uncharacterized membrane protein YgcG
MNSQPEERDVEIIALVEKLRTAPARSSQASMAGRAEFLAEAQSYALSKPLPLSPSPNGRHKDWKTFFTPKMQPRMAVIPILMVIFLLAFMGTGATVFAAQSSLPDQPLYGVKLASEDVRTSLLASNQSRIDLAMGFADLRLQEVLQLAAEGKPIPETVLARMENHLDLALYTAAALDDQQLALQLLTIQSRMQLELDKLVQLEANSRYSSTVERVRAALLSRLQLVTIGLSDPAAFRQYMQTAQGHSGLRQLPTSSPVTASTITPQSTQAASTPVMKTTDQHWPMVTPWSLSTNQPDWRYGPTQMPTNNQWQNSPTQSPNHNQWDNGGCQDCGGNWGGHDGGGSGGHDGGGSGGGGGWHH